jgi:hypothetical protein
MVVGLEGLGQLKNPMTSSGIEPATFWLVTQCLNQVHYRVLPTYMSMKPKFLIPREEGMSKMLKIKLD